MVSSSNRMFEDQNLKEAPCDLAMITAVALIAPYREQVRVPWLYESIRTTSWHSSYFET
jgi:hypothetical protein